MAYTNMIIEFRSNKLEITNNNKNYVVIIEVLKIIPKSFASIFVSTSV